MILEALLLKYSFLIFTLGAIFAALICIRSKTFSVIASSIFTIIASSLSLVSSISSIAYQHHFTLTYNLGFLLNKIELVADPLSAFFIILISLLAIPISIYSIGYIKAEYLEKNISLLCSLYPLFILSMLLVVLSGNGFQFLIFWELMTLISFAFVIFDIKSNESKNAGFIYLLMTHIGSAFLLLAFLICAKYTESFSFASFIGVTNLMTPSLKVILFLFILLGFGTKAGIVPLHIWLPKAHPAAPSHISALMSGVMIKTGIYGILRFVFDFLSPFPSWWGMFIVFIGITTTVLGTIFASSEIDLKRILAYSSIENIGIILLSIGTSMIFYSFDQKVLAAASLVAALFHSFNHSLFKGLLFTCAGSIISATHTGNIEKLGGLIKLMPKTSFLFLIGSLAICAFPLFNGFISEWLTFQTLLSLFQLKSDAIKLITPISASILGFSSAICAAVFIKTFSGIFLGMPRTHQVNHAKEVSTSMNFGSGLLALLCFITGIIPFLVFPLFKTVASSIVKMESSLNINLQNLLNTNNDFIMFGKNDFASITPLSIFVIILISFFFIYIFSKVYGSKLPIRKEETWSCGVAPKAEFEHTPTGFSQPLGVIFSGLHTPESFYHNYIYLPAVNGLINLSHKIRPLQSGVLQIYLLYIFLALIFCLAWIKL